MEICVRICNAPYILNKEVLMYGHTNSLDLGSFAEHHPTARTKKDYEAAPLVQTVQILVVDPPWGILPGAPVFDQFNTHEETTIKLVKHIATVAAQRVSQNGVICLFVPPTKVDPNKNQVALSFKAGFERYVKCNNKCTIQ
jgi:tRNA G10  N-methylase Trm11